MYGDTAVLQLPRANLKTSNLINKIKKMGQSMQIRAMPGKPKSNERKKSPWFTNTQSGVPYTVIKSTHPVHRDDRKYMIFFHGNSTTMRETVHMFSGMTADLPYHIVIPEYRGYDMYQETPNTKIGRADQSKLDALDVYNCIIRRFRPSQIIVVGKSIGSGPALHLSARDDVKVSGVLLISAFTTTVDVFRDSLGNTACWWKAMGIIACRIMSMVKTDMFDNQAMIQKVRAPILIFHGRSDKTVPFHHSIRLFKSVAKTTQVSHIHNNGGHQIHSRTLLNLIQQTHTNLSNTLKGNFNEVKHGRN